MINTDRREHAKRRETEEKHLPAVKWNDGRIREKHRTLRTTKCKKSFFQLLLKFSHVFNHHEVSYSSIVCSLNGFVLFFFSISRLTVGLTSIWVTNKLKEQSTSYSIIIPVTDRWPVRAVSRSLWASSPSPTALLRISGLAIGWIMNEWTNVIIISLGSRKGLLKFGQKFISRWKVNAVLVRNRPKYDMFFFLVLDYHLFANLNV